MDPNDAQVIATSAESVNCDVPRVRIELGGGSVLHQEKLSLTLPYRVSFRLYRIPDRSERPCIIRWNPYCAFVDAHMQLFHIRDSGPEQIEIDPVESSVRADQDAITVRAWPQELQELRPNGEIKFMHNLPMRYQQSLQVGETYQLRWGGRQVNAWEWGGVAENAGKELVRTELRIPLQAPLVIPPSDPITFEVIEESVPWPDRPQVRTPGEFSSANARELRWRMKNRPSPPPLGEADQVDGAPILNTKLECSPECTRGGAITIKLTVTYERGADKPARPFTFRKYGIDSGLHLYRKTPQGSWKAYFNDSYNPGFMLVDDPPIPVKVGDAAGRYAHQFVTLHPGQSWTADLSQEPDSACYLPYDVKNGDEFKYRFKGVKLEWWDWGTKEDHQETEVQLPCFVNGWLEAPKDNGGRPKVVLPGSNEAYLTFVSDDGR